LISDIHASLPALERVLAHARAESCTAFWNLGDLVGYGAFPDETVRLVRKLPGISILGNYDEKVLTFPRKRVRWRKTKQPIKFKAFEWAYENLSKKSRKFLKKRGREARVQEGVQSLWLTHGSPASIEEAILPDTPPVRLRELGAMAGAGIVLCGHSHIPFAFEFEGRWFLNPGSVGRPIDGDPRASYAILELGVESWSIQHYRLEYDVDRAADAIRSRGLPDEFARMLRTGRDLDALGT
jgi:putative phosphoesterase